MINIEINNQVKAGLAVNKVKLVAEVVSDSLKIKQNLNVSVALVSDVTIRKFNRLYRKQDKVTDILSFEAAVKDFVTMPEDRSLGEILICWPRIKQQARENNWSVQEEFLYILVHGLLHLWGYDHEQSWQQAKKMEKLHQKIMSRLGIKANLRYNFKKELI